MKVTKYEIDMLGVGAADAFLIHFFDENETQYVILVDAGYYDNGAYLLKIRLNTTHKI